MKDISRDWVSGRPTAGSSPVHNVPTWVCLPSESMRSFVEEEQLALSLIGSSYEGVSVNDVIYNARTAVDELLGGRS